MVDNVLHNLDVEHIDITTWEEFNDNSEFVICNWSFQSRLQLEEAMNEFF